MGEIIVLPRADSLSPRTPHSDRSAEILFFTGVRYYRMTTDETPPAKTRRPRRSPSGKAVGKIRIDAHA